MAAAGHGDGAAAQGGAWWCRRRREYGPFNTYIPIRSTTIGKSRVARDPIAMHTSWRSNSDIASVTRVSMAFRVVRTNQYNQDLGLIHSTNGNHLESPNEGSSIDHQIPVSMKKPSSQRPKKIKPLPAILAGEAQTSITEVDDEEEADVGQPRGEFIATEINWTTHLLPKIDPSTKGKEKLVEFEHPNPVSELYIVVLKDIHERVEPLVTKFDEWKSSGL
ncbi:pentatricopeptide repeat-containing protein-like [Dorcoceras hygrometricum]|uniref:Pentatricopeptide repeat-containing protein-like n=1 Tax=Dorcoceras hygrometricum TaxID=472368 RepID=A0A2Z7CFG7_9LAMI|nr:pentatricopeptide repeat-containing protein-like [Dorcoceras hygrometricum]